MCTAPSSSGFRAICYIEWRIKSISIHSVPHEGSWENSQGGDRISHGGLCLFTRRGRQEELCVGSTPLASTHSSLPAHQSWPPQFQAPPWSNEANPSCWFLWSKDTQHIITNRFLNKMSAKESPSCCRTVLYEALYGPSWLSGDRDTLSQHVSSWR